MIEITKTLTVSTAHISHLTCDMLNSECELGRWPNLAVYEKVGPDGDKFGWFIYIDPDCVPGEAPNDDMPSDLCACIRLARENDCQLLCLDCDGPIKDGLATYRW